MTKKCRNVILIVDDSKIWLEKISGMLEEMECVESVLQACGYDEAIALLDNRVDFIFLDINMPGKNGIQLLRHIKSNFSDPKVCMVSNTVNEMTRSICKSIGADEYLDKSNEFEKIFHFIMNSINCRRNDC